MSYLTASRPISNHTIPEVGEVLPRSHSSSKHKACVAQTWFTQGCETTRTPWHHRMLSNMGTSTRGNRGGSPYWIVSLPPALSVSVINPFCKTCVPFSRSAVPVTGSLVLSAPHRFSWKGQQLIVQRQERKCRRKLFFHTHRWHFASPVLHVCLHFATSTIPDSCIPGSFLSCFHGSWSTSACQVMRKHCFKAFCFKMALFFTCAVPSIPLPNFWQKSESGTGQQHPRKVQDLHALLPPFCRLRCCAMQ